MNPFEMVHMYLLSSRWVTSEWVKSNLHRFCKFALFYFTHLHSCQSYYFKCSFSPFTLLFSAKWAMFQKQTGITQCTQQRLYNIRIYTQNFHPSDEPSFSMKQIKLFTGFSSFQTTCFILNRLHHIASLQYVSIFSYLLCTLSVPEWLALLRLNNISLSIHAFPI